VRLKCARLLRLQWQQDIDEAARLITKAMQIDDKCEFAYETLGTIEIQRSVLFSDITGLSSRQHIILAFVIFCRDIDLHKIDYRGAFRINAFF